MLKSERIESESDILILDVRTPEEFYSGHVPGAINISHTDLPKRIEEVYPYKDKDIIVYCEQGVRAGIAQDALRKAGFSSILHLEGDMEAWRDSPSLPKGHRIYNRVCIYRPTNQNHL